MDAEGPIFAFELDFAGSLHCIPMCVRLKLDECGIKLSLRQWNRIPEDERRRLVTQACDTPENVAQYRNFLSGVIETHTAGPVEFVDAGTTLDFGDDSGIPPRIAAYAASIGVAPPSQEQWQALSALQRFALFKLTRPGHKNDNFIPAMREFGVLEAQ
jgi:hypothetical protein